MVLGISFFFQGSIVQVFLSLIHEVVIYGVTPWWKSDVFVTSYSVLLIFETCTGSSDSEVSLVTSLTVPIVSLLFSSLGILVMFRKRCGSSLMGLQRIVVFKFCVEVLC